MVEKFTFFWRGPFGQWAKTTFSVSFNESNNDLFPRLNLINKYQKKYDDLLVVLNNSENKDNLQEKFGINKTIDFNCAEQFMMFMKALTFNDYETALLILLTNNPREQQRLGREVDNYDEEIWDSVNKDVVYIGNYYKFLAHDNSLHELYKTTGTTLVEASPVDKRWGIGLAEDNPAALNRETWRGTNWLGQTLTELRDDFLSR